jgi:hypothetical protein
MKAFFRLSLLILISLTACRKSNTYYQGSTNLRFSTDTLLFDTVFTTVGSITKRIKVYNDLDEDLQIDEIKLAGSEDTPYRLNIDGLQNDVAKDVLLRSKDSLHIFVEVTIDPNNTNQPHIHTDSITFLTNGNLQDVDLVAWGQDAHFYYSNSFLVYTNEDAQQPNDTVFFYNISNTTNWTDDKPHVIYGNVFVRNGGTLNINPGSKIYLHHNANIIVLEGSSLKIRGDVSNPVLVTSDRLDEYYKDIPGQWGRIWLAGGSSNNIIENATIKNGSIGLYVDTVTSRYEPNLILKNTIISNHSNYGIRAYSSNIKASNCQISDNGIHDLYLFAGGDYRFSHCTFANYNSGHAYPSVRMSNYYEDNNGQEQLRPMIRADFENCIIYGSIESEVGIESSANALFDFKFNHCLMKLKKSDYELSNTNYFEGNLFNESPKFIQTMSAYEYNYELDSLSPAINSGRSSTAYQFRKDFYGNSRLSDEGPDIGAFERIE